MDKQTEIKMDRQMYKDIDSWTDISKQSDRQIERQIDKESDIWTDIQTNRQAYRQSDC